MRRGSFNEQSKGPPKLATAPKGAAPEEKSDVRDNVLSSRPQGSPQQILQRLHARLHPHWCGGRDGYRYSVIFRGECIVSRSRDPETDAARALLTKGITGRFTLLDGKTGRPRTLINIEKAAKLVTTEENRSGLRLRKPPKDTDNSPSSLETGAVEAVVAESNWGAR